MAGEKNKKIKILGAGISGLTAGIILSKHGYQVEIFDKRSRVGSYFIKDIHSIRNYMHDSDVIETYNKLGIKMDYVYPVFKEFRFSPSFKNIEIFSNDKPLFYNFIRGYNDTKSFDVMLYENAKENGVEFYFNQMVDKSDVDIVATGTGSVKGISYGGHYSNVSVLPPNSLYIFLNNDYSPHGYSYILSFEKEASIVIASTEVEDKEKLKKRFENLKNNNPIIKEIIKNAKFENEIFGFAYYDLPETAVKNGKLYVGEATGFLDAATGFGTHYAILSGYLAAKSIIENKNYDELWRDEFGIELKKQYLKRKELEKIDNNDYEKIIQSFIEIYGEKISSIDYKLRKSKIIL